MQYILSEEEYRLLKSNADEGSKRISRGDLQKLCTLAANSIPVDRSWDKEDKEPWGCILTTEYPEWYCDDCPVQDWCPNQYKSWSK